MASRRSTIEELFNVFYELASFFWPIGLIISSFFGLGSILTLEWSINRNNELIMHPSLATLAKSVGWTLYLIPIFLAIFCIIFVIRTIATLQRNSY